MDLFLIALVTSILDQKPNYDDDEVWWVGDTETALKGDNNE